MPKKKLSQKPSSSGSRIKLWYGTGSVVCELATKEVTISGGYDGMPVCLHVTGNGGRSNGGALWGYNDNPIVLNSLARTIMARLAARKSKRRKG